ncbi:MAG: hypothetical protein V1744_08765, partial [Candidatus Altiarchaeota archaeon]
MVKSTGDVDSIKRLREIIKGSSVPQKKQKQTVSSKLSSNSQGENIKRLMGLMRKPPQGVADSGNLKDLKSELKALEANSKELEGKILEANAKIQKIEWARSKFQDAVQELKGQEFQLQESLTLQHTVESSIREQLNASLRQ